MDQKLANQSLGKRNPVNSANLPEDLVPLIVEPIRDWADTEAVLTTIAKLTLASRPKSTRLVKDKNLFQLRQKS